MKRVKDKKEKLKKVKPKYSLASNLFFIFKQLYKDYGLKVVVAFVAIVASVLLEQVFVDIVPAVAVNAIENQMGVQYFFITVGLAIIGYSITRAVQLRAKEWWNIYGQFTRIFTFIGMMIEKSLKTDYANVESHENQKLIGKANSAISGNWRGIERVYKEFPYVLVNGLGMLLYGGLIVMVDFKILIVLICMLFCNIWFNGYARNFVNRTREENSEVERKLWYLSEGAKDIVAGKDARIYRMEKWFGDLMEAYVEKGVKWQKRVEKHYYLPVLSDTLFIALRDGLAYIILIHLAVSGEISLAVFTLMLGVITHFSDWLFAFVGSWNDMIDANVPIGDVRDMLELKDRFKREGGVEIDASQFPPEIELKDVSFWYDNEDEKILSNINLHIKNGEKIALVGNNGAGKTTLVKLLCGFYEPKEGEILVNGIPLREYNIESYFKMLGIVFQDMDDQGFSMLNTVCCQSDKDADIDRFWKAVEAAGLKSKIESLEKKEQTYLSPILDENGICLSGGEMQKLMLARCIYKDAPFLILDEPTAALDPLAESVMYEEYNNLTENKTSLFISHRLASTRFCDRILFLENGQIAESGSHDELMKKKGRYAKIYDIQSHYYKEDGDIEDMEAAYEG